MNRPSEDGAEPVWKAAILDKLFERRRVLLLLYGAALCCLFSIFLFGNRLPLVEFENQLLPPLTLFGLGDPYAKWPPFRTRLVIVVVFLAAQVLFIWGAGAVNLSRRSNAFLRGTPAAIVVATGASLLFVGLMAVMAEFTSAKYGVWFGLVFGGQWILWLYLALDTLRQPRSAGEVLSTWTATLHTGSWFEFAVALPLHLIVRKRSISCPCDTGSWMAVLISTPILLWAIGPAIVLLFIREARLAAIDPNRPTRIVMEKSKMNGIWRRMAKRGRS